MGVKLGLSR